MTDKYFDVFEQEEASVYLTKKAVFLRTA